MQDLQQLNGRYLAVAIAGNSSDTCTKKGCHVVDDKRVFACMDLLDRACILCRAKAGEAAFLDVYQKLYEAPDPSPALGHALVSRLCFID